MLINLFGKSIKTQLTVLLFALTAMAIIVVGFLGVRAVLSSGNKAANITSISTQQRVEEFLVQNVNATAAKNSTIFKNIQLTTNNATALTDNILDNPQDFPSTNWQFDAHAKKQPAGHYENPLTEPSSVFVQKYITITPAIKREMELTSYLDYSMPQQLSNLPDAVAMYYIGTQGETRYYPNIGLGDQTGADYNPTLDTFYTPATPQNNPDKKVVWSKVYNDPAQQGLLITAADPLYTTKGFSGIIGTDVSLNNIAKNIEDYSPIESSYSFLVDNEGRAIAFPVQAYQDILGRKPTDKEFGPDLKAAKGDFAAIILKMKQGKQGFGSVNASKGNLYVAYAPVEGTPFSLAIVAKQDVLLKVVSDLRGQVEQSGHQVLYFQILPFAAIILFGVWILGFLYIRILTGPIIELTQKTNLLMQGDFTQKIAVTSSNEVGTLGTAFNRMTGELAESYRALEEKVRERTQALDQKVEELGQAKAKDDAILASIGEGMIVADANGSVLLMNIPAAQLFGVVEPEAVVGRPVTDYPLLDEKGTPLSDINHPLERALQEKRKITQTLTLTIDDKNRRALHVTTTPVLQNGRLIGAIQIMRDITTEKEVDRMKTEFISLASHQLRTPLSAIKWFGEMLLEGDAGNLSDEQHDFVKNMSDSTQRMIDLVNSLLNISRIESGRILVDPKPTNVRTLIDNIMGDLKAKIEERHQNVTVSIPDDLPEINLDQRLISQVYMNLLTNAIKYTPKSGHISVTLSVKDNELVSEISDNGYGIPIAEQNKLFQKFFRAQNIVKIETDGTGLGMYLVKAIVEEGGGRIWFKSEEGKGSSFWFSVPMSGMVSKKGEVTID